MAAVGGGGIGELGKFELQAVEGIELAPPGAVEDLRGNVEDDSTRSLAIEGLVLDDERVAVRVDEFHPADELEVLAEDGQLLAPSDLFAVLLGEAGDDGMAEGQVLLGFRLVVRRTDDQFAAGGGDARGSRHAQHVIADMLETGDGHPVGKDDFTDLRHAAAIDGHRLSGDDLRREESLDGQSGLGGAVVLYGITCHEHAREGNGQHDSEIGEYLFHC